MRQEHRAGEKLFVDYAGETVPLRSARRARSAGGDLRRGTRRQQLHLLPKPTWSQSLADWIGAHVRAFDFLGGVPEMLVPDNLKSGVTKSCRYEPDLNPTYEEMAAHYGVAVVPARPRSPGTRRRSSRACCWPSGGSWPGCRNRTFFSLGRAERSIARLLVELNERPFAKLPGCRRSLFEQLDRPALGRCPRRRTSTPSGTRCASTSTTTSSSPPLLLRAVSAGGQGVRVRAAAATVEMFHRGRRVASHVRSFKRHDATTVDEHGPKAHQRYLEWTPSRLVDWAAKTGPARGCSKSQRRRAAIQASEAQLDRLLNRRFDDVELLIIYVDGMHFGDQCVIGAVGVDEPFLQLAVAHPGRVQPRVINVDGHPAYPAAVANLKRSGQLGRRCRCRRSPYLNNILEQDHRFVKKRVTASQGLRSVDGALNTIAGYEAMYMIRKGQIRWLPKTDVVGQVRFIERTCGLAA